MQKTSDKHKTHAFFKDKQLHSNTFQNVCTKNRLVNQMGNPCFHFKYSTLIWCIAGGCLTCERDTTLQSNSIVTLSWAMCKILLQSFWCDCYMSKCKANIRSFAHIFCTFILRIVFVCVFLLSGQTLESLIRRKGSNCGCKHTWNE